MLLLEATIARWRGYSYDAHGPLSRHEFEITRQRVGAVADGHSSRSNTSYDTDWITSTHSAHHHTFLIAGGLVFDPITISFTVDSH